MKKIETVLVFLAILILFFVVLKLDYGQEQQVKEENLEEGPGTDPAVVDFSLDSGVYSGTITVSIGGIPDKGEVHYTLDGSFPNEQSPVYEAPLKIKKSTVVRAAVLTHKGFSKPVTATYLVNAAHTLPIFSLVIEPENLWSEDKGIYITGKNASNRYPYKGANYWQDWRVPVNLEYFQGGESVYKTNAGLKIFGGETRTQPQKSLALYAKKEYGDKTFNYPFFPEKDFKEYNTFVLRNGGQDFPKTHMLDGMVSTLVTGTSIDFQAYRPVVVYLNGEYWGIHDLREKIDKDFLGANHGVKKSKIDLLEANGVVKEGSNEDYLKLVEFIKNNDLSNDESYQRVMEQMDLDNYMDYVIAELYIANTDWPSHNIRFWKAEDSSGKWRWILYDSDLSFENYQENTVQRLIDYKGKGDNSLYVSFLFRQLMKNGQFRTAFWDRAMYHLDTTFVKERVIGIIHASKEELQPEIDLHLAKWGGTRSGWEQNIGHLEEFAEKRPEYLLKQLQALYELYD